MVFNKISIFLKTLYQGYRECKLAIIVLAILGFFSALLEGVGINALVPLFSFIVSKKAENNDVISRIIEKFFIFFNIEFRLKYLLVFIAVLFISKAILAVVCEYIRIKISADYEERVRNKLFKKFLDSSWPYLLKQKLGHLQTVLTINVQNASAILSYISGFIIMITGLIVYGFVAISINPTISLFTLCLSIIIFLGFMPFIRRIRNYSYNLESINRKIGHHVNENIIGMKTLKIMSVINQVIKSARANFRELKNIKIAINVRESIISSVMQPISLVFILVVFAFSYKSVDFNLASFIAIVYLIKQIFAYTEALQKKVLSFNSTIPYFKSISDYESQTDKYREINSGLNDFALNSKLELKNIKFSYDNDKIILSDVNFVIKKGDMIGLIGPSGAGKTTIVDLILRLFEPTSGKIYLDGKDINSIDIKQWRKNIGYVSQDIFLMNDTIAANIKFYDDSITDEGMIEAAKMANIYDFIQECPNKFNTVIGERGVELSAGQRQRIVIARILARKPQLLIFDEATSALDNESETKIQKVIESLKGKITVFVIAHRLSTIMNSDRLLVLERGGIVEQGKPSELLGDKKSYFYKVYNIRNK